ncbi:MAG: beta-N-acetylglucosaminidase domain-containing protein, partial [Bacteriovoracia bacterium]
MTFNIRGVIEGFYGFYYTFSERNDLIKFLGNNNFNYYIYAPK